jgi:hypothetical protein
LASKAGISSYMGVVVQPQGVGAAANNRHLYLVVWFVTGHWLVAGILVGIFFWYSRPRSTPSGEHLMLQPHPSPISEPSLSVKLKPKHLC